MVVRLGEETAGNSKRSIRWPKLAMFSLGENNDGQVTLE